jgi:hypothetical protein
MARFGAQWDDYEQDKPHKKRMIKKVERIEGLRDLLATWEAHEEANGHRESDHREVLELRARLRAAQNQLEAMAV